MIKEGVLQNPAPTSIFGQHVHPPLEAGKIGLKGGMYMASADEIYITVKGQGGHGALPQDCVDPITIAVFAERSTSCAEISLIVILLPDNFCKSTEIFPEPETRLLIVLDFITKLSDVVPMPPPAVSEIDPRVSIFAVSTEATERLSPSVIFPAVETVTPPEVVTRLLPS